MTSSLSLRDVIAQESHPWEYLWTRSITPWDRGAANPYLLDFIEKPPNGIDLPRGGKALIAGCGRGYDVALFRDAGFQAWGIDISETAVQAARKWISSAPYDATSSGGTAEFHAVDFFEFPIPDGGFEIAWDLTFFCALHPSQREAWAKRYTTLLSSNPRALLVTLCFPIDGNRLGGPPWSVSVEAYEAVLSGNLGWKKIHEGPGGEGGRLVVWGR
ncbi:TPMT family [Phaffia rhodozyma]|uniref:TPMT family n=1 Tax=Phaffia rhodozyma TaxID=264483 RepID=A0A0F7SI01_PHARH|nr:TPMT family [Phaffia rhodozyma]